MHVQGIQTKLIQPGENLFQLLANSLPAVLPERSVLVLASKLVSTCENRFVTKVTGEKDEKYALVRQEAEFYLEPTESQYEIMFTIKGNWMFANAGIDESNAYNQYILWPADPQASVIQIWQWLREQYNLKEVGVTMSDSRSMPLNWGVVGHGIAACGFLPLYSYIGREDLFGRSMKMEQFNLVQSITSAATIEMGEGAERRPMALVSDLPEMVEFLDHSPTPEELAAVKISLEDDIYAPFFNSVEWHKGGGGKDTQTNPIVSQPSSTTKTFETITLD